MTRVHTVTRAGRRQRSASVRTNQKKPTFKIVKEVVIQEKKKFRTVASYNAEPPSGYSFIPVGYPDLTELCKKKCQDQNLQFQTVNATPKNKANLDPDKVSHHIHRVGNHFPTDIVQRACMQLGYWINPAKPGEYKKYNVGLENQLSRHRHKDDKDKIKSAIQELFPHLPPKDLKEILQHAFRKGSMRVGNADMPLIRRVQLAVSAHARHNYTEYDQLLKKISWGEARQAAEQPTLNQLKKWRGEDFDNHEIEQVLRETIILDSESDDDSDAESTDDSVDTAARNGERDISLEFISQNTFGDDRTSEFAHNGHAVRDAFVAPSRRQAEYQALHSVHRRDVSASHRPQRSLYDSLQPPPLVPIDNYYDTRTNVDASAYPHSSQARPAAHVDYRPAHHVHDRSRTVGDYDPIYQVPRRTEPSLGEAVGQAAYRAYPEPSYDRVNTAHRGTDAGHTDRLVSGPRSRPYESVYRDQNTSHSDSYDPHYPRLIRDASSNYPLASIETDVANRHQQLPPVSSPQGPRLITDRNGQSIVVAPLAASTSVMPPSHRHGPGYPATDGLAYPLHTGDAASEAKRRRSSPQPVYRAMPPRALVVDLTQEAPSHRPYHPQHSQEQSRPYVSYHTERRVANDGHAYQPAQLPNQDLGYSPHDPVWLDGASDRNYVEPAPRYQNTFAPASKERVDVRGGPGQPGYGYSMREQPRLVPVDRDERREPQQAAPQTRQHPDDAMRSLYDEREPQQPRKAHKKHHASRPRYHDHDSSALRQQDQALDYT